MKVVSSIESVPTAGLYQLPQGLVGFPQHKSFEILYNEEELPFCWLRLFGPSDEDPIHFVIIDPTGVIPEYEPELFDEDAQALKISSGDQAAIFNIVTVKEGVNASATANLVGPIVINRETGIARQVVLSNYHQYSAYHNLVIGEEG